MSDAFIYEALRTPRARGRADGELHEVTPIRLAATVLEALRDRIHLDTTLLEDVILGVVTTQGEQSSDIGRLAVMAAGYDESVPGLQINRFCSSGLEAVNLVAAKVMAGQAELAIGGGVESMSREPLGRALGSWAVDPYLAIPTHFSPQGVSVDLMATKYGITREQVDQFALSSQQRTAAAQADGRFNRSLVPVRDVNGQVILDRDAYPRPETTLENLASLRPAFEKLGREGGFDAICLQRYPEVERIEHIHHAGNSSGIVDGAAAVLVGSAAMGERLGLKPRARIRAFANIGSEPTIMLTGPAPSSERALRIAGMQVGDIDLFEVNEAFAAVPLRFAEQLDVPLDKINVNGGAIALGHPLGATGAMLLGTLIDELERQDLATGLVTLCVGAGMGTATIIERV